MPDLELYVEGPAVVSLNCAWYLYHVDAIWHILDADEMHAVIQDELPYISRWVLLDEEGETMAEYEGDELIDHRLDGKDLGVIS